MVSDVETALYAKGGDHFVLILDEVNLFKQHDIVNLLELSNASHLSHIKMTVISFGRPEIEQLITSLQEQNKHQLIARFFPRPKSFEGYRTKEMLEDVLRFLDEGSPLPLTWIGTTSAGRIPVWQTRRRTRLTSRCCLRSKRQRDGQRLPL